MALMTEGRRKAIRDRAFSDGNDPEMALTIAANLGALVSVIKVDGPAAFAARNALRYHVGSWQTERGEQAGRDGPPQECPDG